MKRSAMVQSITIELLNHNFNMKYDVAEYLAENILTRIEKEGMIPPNSKKYEKAVDLNWEQE